MTPECALTKLSYLLGHPEYDAAMIPRLMTESLRGEITIKNQYPDEDNTSQNPTQQHSLLGEILSSTLESCHQSLRNTTNDVLRPLLMHQAAANGDLTALAELDSRRTYIDSADYQGKTCLHIAIMNGKLNAVKWLVEHGANVHARDSFGNNSVSPHTCSLSVSLCLFLCVSLISSALLSSFAVV
jgi:60kDa lysophospholipase